MPAAADRIVNAARLEAPAATAPAFPGLERLAGKIANGLGAAIAASGGRGRVAPVDLRTTSFSTWKASLPEVVAVARFRAAGLRGGMLASVPAALLGGFVDRFYGGDGHSPVKPAALGGAGERLFDRFARIAAEMLAAAWIDLAPLTVAVAGTNFVRDELSFGRADDMVVIHRFSLDGGGDGRTIEIVYPMAGLRAINGLQREMAPGAGEVDPHWQLRLADAVMQARLPVRTVIARPTVPLSRLMSLEPGDFIPVTLPARVPLTVAGRLLAHGTIGEANGRAAIMIDRIEAGESDD